MGDIRQESEKSSSEETNGREECMKYQVMEIESKNQIVHLNRHEDEDSENEWIVAGRRENPRITKSIETKTRSNKPATRGDKPTCCGRNYWSCLEDEELNGKHDRLHDIETDRNWKSKSDSERDGDTQTNFEIKSGSDCIEISVKEKINSRTDPTKWSVELKKELVKDEYQKLVELKVYSQPVLDLENYKSKSDQVLNKTDHGQHQETGTRNSAAPTEVLSKYPRGRSKQRKHRNGTRKGKRRR